MSGSRFGRRCTVAVALLLCATGAQALEGRVVAIEPGCPHFVVQTSEGFMIYEHLQGPKPKVDDTIEGNLERPGSWKARNVSASADVMLYLEAGPVPQRRVEERIPFKCKKNRPAAAAPDASSPGDR
jgi:hypothetical protein